MFLRCVTTQRGCLCRQLRRLQSYGRLLGEPAEALRAAADGFTKAQGDVWLHDAAQRIMARVRGGEMGHLLRRDEL